MKNKLIFRILGALASALIISSVFVPFVSVTGYSVSLWETFESDLYLPIMIIVFGAIGVIFFSLNVKTEFAYMSTGAISFFLVMQTIDIVNQGVFNTLSVGYYFLAIGALLTGIMAFLTNLKSKKVKEEVVTSVQTNETTMLDQIDKLYSEQTTIENGISPIQPVDNVVQPLPVQPIENITPVQPLENQQVSVPVDIIQPQQTIEEPINIQNVPVQAQVEIPVQPQPAIESVQQVAVNPVVQEFSVEQPMNPVINGFATEQAVQTNPVIEQFANITHNPVVNEFSNPIPQQNPKPIVQPQPITEPVTNNVPLTNLEEPTMVNPVVNSFTNPGSTVAEHKSNDLDIFG